MSASRRSTTKAGAPAPLAAKRFVVTGASSGIGAGVAAELALAGAEVILLGRNRARLARTAASLGGMAVRVLVVDFASERSLARALRELHAERGSLHGLVHCAGAFDSGRLGRFDRRTFARLMRVNVEAPMSLTLGLRTRLAEHSDVVFVNSSIVQRPAVEAAYYAATKHALRSLTDSLRQELNPRGTRVLSLFPGRTATPMQRRITRGEGAPYEPRRLMQPADIGRLVVSVLALPVTIEVTDVFMRPRIAPPRSASSRSRAST